MNNGKNCLGETIDTNIVNIMQWISYEKKNIMYKQSYIYQGVNMAHSL